MIFFTRLPGFSPVEDGAGLLIGVFSILIFGAGREWRERRRMLRPCVVPSVHTYRVLACLSLPELHAFPSATVTAEELPALSYLRPRIECRKQPRASVVQPHLVCEHKGLTSPQCVPLFVTFVVLLGTCCVFLTLADNKNVNAIKLRQVPAKTNLFELVKFQQSSTDSDTQTSFNRYFDSKSLYFSARRQRQGRKKTQIYALTVEPFRPSDGPIAS